MFYTLLYRNRNEEKISNGTSQESLAILRTDSRACAHIRGWTCANAHGAMDMSPNVRICICTRNRECPCSCTQRRAQIPVYAGARGSARSCWHAHGPMHMGADPWASQQLGVQTRFFETCAFNNGGIFKESPYCDLYLLKNTD